MQHYITNQQLKEMSAPLLFKFHFLYFLLWHSFSTCTDDFYYILSSSSLILFHLFFYSPFPYSINIVLFSSPHTPTGRYPAYDGYPLYIINWQIGQVLYFILLLCHGLCDFVSYDKKIAICRMKSFHFNIINVIDKNYKYSRSIMHLLPLVNDERFIWFDLITNI